MLPCPNCGGKLELVTGMIGEVIAQAFTIRGDEPKIKMRPGTFVACSACEYCTKEIPK